MGTSLSLRLAWAALIVLALPGVVPTLSRCAGQEPGAGADDARPAANQKATARVLAAEVRTGLVVFWDPDEAYQSLKNLRDALTDNPALSDSCREGLLASLERAMGGVIERGVEVKQRQIERQEYRAELRARVEGWRFQLRQLSARLGLSPDSE